MTEHPMGENGGGGKNKTTNIFKVKLLFMKSYAKSIPKENVML